MPEYKLRSGLTSGITNTPAETYTEEGQGWGREGGRKPERSSDEICWIKWKLACSWLLIFNPHLKSTRTILLAGRKKNKKTIACFYSRSGRRVTVLAAKNSLGSDIPNGVISGLNVSGGLRQVAPPDSRPGYGWAALASADISFRHTHTHTSHTCELTYRLMPLLAEQIKTTYSTGVRTSQAAAVNAHEDARDVSIPRVFAILLCGFHPEVINAPYRLTTLHEYRA